MAQAATVLSYSFVSSDDTTGFSRGTSDPAQLSTDTFAYSIFNPTAAAPNQSATATDAHGETANAGEAMTIDFALASAFTTTVDQAEFIVDLWGRAGSPNRDDDFTITLLNGATVVATSASTGLPDATQYNRVAFNSLALGTQITGFRIVAQDTGGSSKNFFALSEMRVGAVPEPSSTALLGLSALALLARRRK